jgi:FtsZ-binding cell division protein ZapB
MNSNNINEENLMEIDELKKENETLKKEIEDLKKKK